MTKLDKKREKLSKKQAALKQQLMSRRTKNTSVSTQFSRASVSTQFSRAMDERDFLLDIERHIKTRNIPIRKSVRIHRSLYFDYDVFPFKKICGVCGTKKHYHRVIGPDNNYHFVCPECKSEAESVYIQIRWSGNYYKICFDNEGHPFNTVSEANYYMSLIDDKAHCGIKSCIYFIQAESNGYIKIGFSNDITNRITSLRMACPCKLKVLLVLSGGVNIEALHHNHFKEHHSHGEWFRPHESLLQYIEENQKYCLRKSLNISD